MSISLSTISNVLGFGVGLVCAVVFEDCTGLVSVVALGDCTCLGFACGVDGVAVVLRQDRYASLPQIDFDRANQRLKYVLVVYHRHPVLLYRPNEPLLENVALLWIWDIFQFHLPIVA